MTEVALATQGDDPFDSAACGLFVMAADGTLMRANATLAKWMKVAPLELVGRSFQSLLDTDSRLFLETHWWPLLVGKGAVTEVQLELADSAGEILPVLVNAERRASVDPSQALIDVALFVVVDRRRYERELLLARKEAEELLVRARVAEEGSRQRELDFRALAENSPDIILRFDGDRRFVYVNPSAMRLTGRTVESRLGRRIEEVESDPKMAHAWSVAIEEAFDGRESTLDVTYASIDGTRRDIEAHLVPEKNADGEVVNVLAIARDITLLRRQEVEAQQRAVLAEQLIGIVSHDLRNPLNAVMLGAHLLGAADLGTHARTVARILSATQRANRLIGDLLDFTQARLGGGLDVNPRELDLHDAVSQCIDEVKMAWPGRMIEHHRVGSGLGAGDPDRIAQVVTNLTTNALVYGAPQEPVSITTRVGETTLEVQVHNAGPPIPEDLMPQIFEPLRRGSQQVRLGSRSVGLGLYIVREIVVAHGGQVSVHSRAGEGTTFSVVIPRFGEELTSVPGD